MTHDTIRVCDDTRPSPFFPPLTMHGLRTLLPAVALFLAPVAASAQVTRPTAQLRYRVAPEIPGCPPESTLRQSVATRLGQDPFEADARSHIEATVARRPGGLVGRVSAQDADGREVGAREVTVRAGACASLVEMMAVTITLAFEQPALRRPVEAPAPPPLPPPTPTPTPEAPPPSRPSEDTVAADALVRLEAALVEEAEQQRDLARGLGLANAITGAAFLGAGLYLSYGAETRAPERGQAMIALGVASLSSAAIVAFFGDSDSERVLATLRSGRALGTAPSSVLAETELAWSNAATALRRRRRYRGVLLLSLGGVFTGLGTVFATLGRDDDRGINNLLTGTTIAIGLAGLFVGVRELNVQDPVERGWQVYRRVRPPTLAPTLGFQRSGAMVGVVAAF